MLGKSCWQYQHRAERADLGYMGTNPILNRCIFLPMCYCNRCRLSASPATGLVGMQENSFLKDFFGCVGFLPLTTHRCRMPRFASSRIFASNAPCFGAEGTTRSSRCLRGVQNILSPKAPVSLLLLCSYLTKTDARGMTNRGGLTLSHQGLVAYAMFSR